MKTRMKIVVGILAVIASLGLLASPASAASGSGAGPYYSGGSGSSRQCAFFGWEYYTAGSNIYLDASIATTKGSSCTTALNLPPEWLKVVIQPQYLGANLQWVNLDVWECTNQNTTNKIDPCATGIWGAPTNRTYRVVYGYEALLQGASRQHLVVTSPFNLTPSG